MSRCMSVGQLKVRGHHHLEEPTPGSKIREVYDFFMSNKGRVVNYTHIVNHRNMMERLVDDYGLDIRCVKRGQWLLAGEWVGRVYIDYVVERMAEEQSVA